MFIPADKRSGDLTNAYINSVRKFHSEKELPIRVYDNPNPQDVAFWYRSKPIIAKDLIKEYELVIGCDNDMICFGPLDHILNPLYDVGTVLNINRVDPQVYGYIQFQGIPPQEYYNNGLVATRSEDFVNRWYDLCFSKYFERWQYREQDALNILAHYGGYNVRCFDHAEYAGKKTFSGLVSKGETNKAILRGKEVIIPRGEDNYPDQDTVLKIWHCGGGSGEKKANYRIHFNEELIKHINWLIGKEGNL